MNNYWLIIEYYSNQLLIVIMNFAIRNLRVNDTMTRGGLGVRGLGLVGRDMGLVDN